MIKKLIQWGMTVVALALATSCSNTKIGDLLDQVPVNCELVVVGDVETVLKSAGGEIKDGQIKLPSSIEGEMPSYMSNGLDDVNELIKEAGINPEAACMVNCSKYVSYRQLYIFKVDDKKKLLGYLDDNRYRERDEEDGLTIFVRKDDNEYSSYHSYVGVKDSYVYVMPDVYYYDGMDFNPERAINKFVEAAKDEPMGGSKAAKYVAQGNAGGIIMHITKEMRNEMRRDLPPGMTKFMEGFVCMRADLGENDLTVTTKIFDEDGKERDMEEFGNVANLDAKIDKESLTYLGKDENMVFAVSLKDVKWGKYLDMVAEATQMSRSQRGVMDVVQGYLQKIDGTVAVGYGLKGGLDAIADLGYGNKPMEAMAFTLVVQTKENKAKGIISELKTMMDNYGIPYESTASGFSIKPDENMEFYAEAKKNYVVISNHRISQGVNDAVKALNFSDYICAGSIVFNKDNKMMRDLGIDNDVVATFTSDPKNCEGTIKIEIKGGKAKGFVGKALGIILDVVSNEKAITRKMEARYEEIRSERYGSYNSEYETYAVEPDYYAVDTVEVVEEW